MKAARINEFGSAGNVNVVEIEKPTPKEGQVLVEVHAASVNPFDTTVREGRVGGELPITLGGDIAGVVVDAGAAMHIQVGDKVYGQANVVSGASGAFAEFAATSAEQVAKMPANLGFLQAASIPLVGLSALQVIQDHMQLKSGQKILIHGGAGGIGTVAIQIAKHLGAYVATTATGEGIEYVKSLGADQVIDYKTEVFDEILSDFDAVFDTVSGETYERSFKVLKPGGIIVSMLSQPDEELMKKYNIRAVAQMTRTSVESLNTLTKLIEQGVVTPHVDKVFPLEQVKEAFEARENGSVRGKVVIEIKPR